MSYEIRRGRRYYYDARRVDGRVQKKYLGNGPAAERAAAEVAQRQRDRLEQRRRDRRFELRLIMLRDEFEQFWHASERALRLALVASNYHYHRGTWRRRHEC